MARPKSTDSKSMSDVVREYLKANSTASVAQIVDDLKPYGISQSLAQKIKYNKQTGSGRGGRKPRRVEPAAARASNGPSGRASKADAIRRIAQGMGKRLRPRDVIATLAAEGVSVSSAQVGQVLKKMGMRRRPRGRKPAGLAARSGRPSSANSQSISLEALMAAKKLANELGGVQAAKLAMDALAKLS